MTDTSSSARLRRYPPLAALRPYAAGVALSGAVAIVAATSAPYLSRLFPIPAIVLALLIGMALNPLARHLRFQRGITFCVKTLLRWMVALLGLRIALGEVLALGIGTALLIIFAMAVTLVSGLLLARFFGQSDQFGVLAGAGTAVCGASATLATSAVLPNYNGKEADVAFVVIAVNALSTLAMVLYPPLCAALSFNATTTGIMLGATIHDVAQVAGAGYAAGEQTGNAAVIVKLFRVLLLFPVVVAVAWWFLRPNPPLNALKDSVPSFALVFIALCILNSVLVGIAGVQPVYQPIKALLSEVSSWGLLTAIGALGLGTSVSAVAALGLRHVAIVFGTTIVILGVVCGSLIIAG